ncbi:MAG TPA: response regulator transcription factor [Deferrisomatales bacterium]|nr:response regulator transcription factor [Deferrisomatales bacterium]
MRKPHILLVEDEVHIARGLVFNLESEGCAVTHVETGEDALTAAEGRGFALVVLDVMLPGIGGFEVCRRLRQRDPRLPILMLTARTEEGDRVAGLSAGADDYLTKPFSLEEFLLRVRGMLRRSEWYRPGTLGGYRFGANEVWLEEHRARTPRGEVQLTELEARFLRELFRNEGRVLSRTDLLATVWHLPHDAETRTLDNFVVRMRKYFEQDPAHPRHLHTVRGRGYRFTREGED